MEVQLAQLWEANDYPSQIELYKLAKKNNIAATNAQIKNFLSTKVSGQILRAKQEPYRVQGKFQSTRESEKLYADLIDFSLRPDKDFSVVLVVVDSFTKKVYLEKTKTKTQEEIVQAFDRILGRIGGTQQPSLIFTDKDAAFGVVNGKLNEESAFARNLEREEINQKLKVGRNDIAPVDAAIFKIKQRLKKIKSTTQDKDGVG